MNVSVTFFCTCIEALSKQHGNRGIRPDKLNEIAEHLGIAEQLFKTLPPATERDDTPPDDDEPRFCDGCGAIGDGGICAECGFRNGDER